MPPQLENTCFGINAFASCPFPSLPSVLTLCPAPCSVTARGSYFRQGVLGSPTVFPEQRQCDAGPLSPRQVLGRVSFGRESLWRHIFCYEPQGWFLLNPRVLLAELSPSEPLLPVVLAGVGVFGEAVKRVNCLIMFSPVTWSQAAEPGPRAQGALGQNALERRCQRGFSHF